MDFQQQSSSRPPQALPVVLVVVSALVASLLVWVSTRFGVGTTPDSVQYLLGARSLMQGGALVDLPRLWPPLYPSLLAVSATLSGDLISGVRAFQVLIAGLNVLLIGALLWLPGQQSRWFAVATVLAFALSPVLFMVHRMAWSESLFLCFMLAHVLALDRAVRGAANMLPLAGLLLGLAILTRYAGVAFLPVSLAWVLLRHGGQGQRGGDIARFLTAAMVLPLGWNAWIAHASAIAAPRQFAVHLIGTEKFRQAADTVLTWAHAWAWGTVLATILLLATALAILVAVFRRGSGLSLVRLCLLLTLAYIGFVCVAISFFEPRILFDARILVPVQALLLVALAASATAADARAKLPQAVALALLVLFAAGGLAGLKAQVKTYTNEGSAYLDPRIATIPSLAFIRSIDPAMRVVSNAPEFIQLHTGRDAQLLPAMRHVGVDRDNARFPAEMGALVQEVAEGRAVVVVFGAFAWREYLPGEAAFRAVGLDAVYHDVDATVFAASPGTGPR